MMAMRPEESGSAPTSTCQITKVVPRCGLVETVAVTGSCWLSSETVEPDKVAYTVTSDVSRTSFGRPAGML